MFRHGSFKNLGNMKRDEYKMTDKEKIKQEIERKQKNIVGAYESEDIEHGYKQCCKEILSFIDSLPEEPTVKGITWEDVNILESLIYQVHNEYPSIGEKSFGLEVLERFQDCQDVIEEPASEDLDFQTFAEEMHTVFALPSSETKNTEEDPLKWEYTIARHFAEWQKQKDEKLFKEDTWNYIEEHYPDITKEEKLRLYDVSIKSRLAGANTIKQKMKTVITET